MQPPIRPALVSRGHRRAGPLVTAALALLCGLLLAACASGEKKETPPPTPVARLEACSLVTRQEVEAALGAAAGEPEKRLLPSGRGTACVFPVTTEAGRRTLQVAVETPPSGRIYSRADILSFATVSGAPPPQPVAGAGEAAYASAGTLHVLAAGKYVSVGDPQPTPALPPYDTEALRKVAQQAVERLPK